MNIIAIGTTAILVGLLIIPIGYPEFKEELQSVREQSFYKKIIFFPFALISFITFDSIIGWIFSLGILLVFSGAVIIFLSVI